MCRCGQLRSQEPETRAIYSEQATRGCKCQIADMLVYELPKKVAKNLPRVVQDSPKVLRAGNVIHAAVRNMIGKRPRHWKMAWMHGFSPCADCADYSEEEILFSSWGKNLPNVL